MNTGGYEVISDGCLSDEITVQMNGPMKKTVSTAATA
jgi:hypothetical protein